MTDPFHVEGPDGITRGLDEHYDNLRDVEQDPTGARLAIQNLWAERERLTAERDALAEALRELREEVEFFTNLFVVGKPVHADRMKNSLEHARAELTKLEGRE